MDVKQKTNPEIENAIENIWKWITIFYEYDMSWWLMADVFILHQGPVL